MICDTDLACVCIVCACCTVAVPKLIPVFVTAVTRPFASTVITGIVTVDP